MNKKGELAESIKSIGGIVLGIGALLVVLFVLYSLFGAFFFEKGPDAETKQSMEGLKEALSELEGNGDYLFRFSKGYNMVVFENGKGSYGSGSNGWYVRPSFCFDDACIILCKDSDDEDSCLNSKYFIKLEVSGFVTDNENGLIYPSEAGNSKDEWLLLNFNKVDGKIKITLSKT